MWFDRFLGCLTLVCLCVCRVVFRLCFFFNIVGSLFCFCVFVIYIILFSFVFFFWARPVGRVCLSLVVCLF